MRKLKRVSVALLIVLALASCEKVEKIDKFPLEPSKLVMNGVLKDGFYSVSISKSLPSIDNASNRSMDDAEVFFYEDGELINSFSQSTGAGVYVFPWDISEDKTYRVDAFHPDYPSISASTTIPGSLDATLSNNRIIDSTWYSYGSPGFEQTNIYISRGSLNVQIEDSEDNSFLSIEPSIFYYRDGNIVEQGYVNLYSSSSGERIGTNLFLDGEQSSLALRNLALEYSTSLGFNASTNIDSVVFSLQVLKYSEDLFLYEKTRAQFFESQQNPFADPVQVYSNVDGGFGVLGGQYQKEVSFRIY